MMMIASLTGLNLAHAAPDAALPPLRDLAHSPAGARLLDLARSAMESYWRGGAISDSATTESLATPDWPGEPTGIFVSLMSDRATRACVGSPVAMRSTLADAVRSLAVEVLRADMRRPPVRHEELAMLRIVISFAGAGEEITDPMKADPGREGLLISSARGHIAFLPGEARTVSWALREARRVGVLEGPLASASYSRYPVVVLEESGRRGPAKEESDVAP